MNRPRFTLTAKAAAVGVLSTALSFGTAGLAAAQPADPNYQAQSQQYQAQQQQYQDQQQGYQAQQEHYQDQRDAYAHQRAAFQDRKAAYEAQRSDYEADRAAYDARWGVGAFDAYQRTHTTTTTYSPAGDVESRSSTTTVITPGQ